MKIETLILPSFSLAFSQLVGDRMVRNLYWYGLAEFCARVSRLITTIVLARTLGATDLGTAAIAITCFELIRVLTNNGISQMVIRSTPELLAATCNTAHRVSRLACATICLLQICVGASVGYLCGRADLCAMISSLALVYLLMLPGLIPVYLLIREARTKELAAIAVAQVSIDNMLTAAFAIAGFGAWSIVLPKLLTTPVWLIGVRSCRRWSRDPQAGEISLRTLIGFSAPILFTEILFAARMNLDKLIVWCVLGVEALGVYYFAFNAGIGLSLALTTALSNSLYPELARLASQPTQLLRRYDSLLRLTALPIAGVILLQALLSPIYVPFVFGQRWASAAALVALLCLSAVTKPFSDSASQLLRAAGKPDVELKSVFVLTFVTLAVLTASLTHGLTVGVGVFAVVSLLTQGSFALVARHYAAGPTSPRATSKPAIPRSCL